MVDTVLGQLIPYVILTIVTILIVIQLKTAMDRKMALHGDSSKCNRAIDHASNASIAFLILYLVCDIPGFISTFLIIVDKEKYVTVYNNYMSFVSTLQLINASLNMVIYCAMSKLFRSTLVDVIKTPIQIIMSSLEGSKITNSIEMSGQSTGSK